MSKIHLICRATGRLENEEIYGGTFLRLGYGSHLISILYRWIFGWWVVRFPWFSQVYGALQRTSWSRRKIAPFIQKYRIDTKEFLTENFSSFDAFFTRKLKPEARPFASTPAILPADGRYFAFETVGEREAFWVKGSLFSLPLLVGELPLAQEFFGGSMVIGRLAPVDYHRFHFPCSGVVGEAREVPGTFFSVNPIALKKRPSILWENKRMVTAIHSRSFGKVLFIEVGATCVGTIHQTYTPNTNIEKGEEKGFFSFGGSCVIVLFQKGAIQLDPDLLVNTKRGYETLAYFGESLGS